MATYETVLNIPVSIEDAFTFVSDFRNAARWDPRTYAVEKTTEGAVGLGTRFMLTGGMLKNDVVRRFHIPRRLAGLPLPYDVVEFDAPNEFVLRGESRAMRWCDHLEFSSVDGGTRLRYYAELHLRGPLALGEPLLKRMFKRIGDDATEGIPAAVASGG